MPSAKAAARSSAPIVLTLGSGALFFFSFLMSGNSNVLPQLFFQRFYPTDKVFLLAVTLVLSTTSSIAGVALSRVGRQRRGAMLAGVAFVTVATIGLGFAKSVALYISLVAAVQFAANYLLSGTDLAAVHRAGSEHRRLNDAIGNVGRLLGMLAAPAFLTGFYRHPTALRVLIAVCGVVAFVGVSTLFVAGLREPEPASTAPRSVRPDGADRLLFGYAVCVYCALYLFAANMIYLLRDWLRFDNAEARGGRAIVVVFVAAVVVNAASGLVRRYRAQAKGLQAAALAAPALALVLSSALLAAGIRPGFGVFLGFCATVGAAYGLFLIELREHTSRCVREQDKTVLLTWFNNMANVSALAAFLMMVALALAGRYSPASYYLWTLLTIGALPAAGVTLLVNSARRLR